MAGRRDHPLRVARVEAGLSQAELAAAGGVSRQMIGAIEAGRHSPNVDAALALARVVGRSVEDLFAARAGRGVPVFDRALPEGTGVLAGRVGDQVVFAAATDSLAFTGWPTPNAVLRGGVPAALPEGDLDGFVAVGCDPALGSVAELMPRRGSRRVIALSGSTAAALAAMNAGRAHAALVHGRSGLLPTPPAGVLRLRVAGWRVGVAGHGPRAPSVAELRHLPGGVVQREPGASSQRAFVAALEEVGASAAPGPVASGHVEVARRVAHGAAAGVTMEPAAAMFGLAFTPLEEHVAELWVDERWRDHPAVATLASTLRSPAFRRRMGLIGGYDVAQSGVLEGAP